MTPRRKLQTANALMLAGIAAPLIGLFWMVASYSPGANATTHVGDALLKLGMVYMVALAVACASAVWSFVVQRRNAGVHVTGGTLLRILVLIGLIGPFVIGNV
ncbi:hypothetical protein [Massilia agri]|uniref:Uncharacterized protein n=1 Tax=Massilia agri TaxID=1886785 RepID=A0ABT2AN86_9BURK|nr:hypothetical protein [Massilia agri]MCS0597711.1 hypothetical protein [Massilia agri]